MARSKKTDEKDKGNQKEDVKQPKITSFFTKPGSESSSNNGTSRRESSGRYHPSRKRIRNQSSSSTGGVVLEEITLSSGSDSEDVVLLEKGRGSRDTESKLSVSNGGKKGAALALSTTCNFDVELEPDVIIIPKPEPKHVPGSSKTTFEVFPIDDDKTGSEDDFLLSNATSSKPNYSQSERPYTENLSSTTSIYCPNGNSTNSTSTSTHANANATFHEAETILIDNGAVPDEIDPFNDDDEILSQIDLDHGLLVTPRKKKPVQEITLSSNHVSPSLLEQSPTLVTPSKSTPKSVVNHQSPVRHLRRSASSRKLTFQSPPKSSRATKALTFSLPRSDSNSSPSQSTNSKSSNVYLDREIQSKEHFITVLTSVMTCGDDSKLFPPAEVSLYQQFLSLSSSAICLYIHIYKRTKTWYRQSSIDYPNIATDLDPVFAELYKSKFFVELKDDPKKPPLETLLNILDAKELKELASTMRVSKNKQNKMALCKAALINITKTQRTLSGIDTGQRVVNGALQLLKGAFRLSEASQSFFTRTFILYSLPNYWDDVNQVGTNHLRTVSLTKEANMVYPVYRISKSTKIYRHPEDLLRFSEGLTFHSQIMASLETKNFEHVISVLQTILERIRNQEASTKEHEHSLPSFLRVYTTGTVLRHATWLGVEAHQKMKHFQEANDVLAFLLTENPNPTYLSHYRGKWHERRIKNANHLKLPMDQRKQFVIQALADPFVQDEDLLGLTRRLTKIRQEEAKMKNGARKRKRQLDDEDDGWEEDDSQKYEDENRTLKAQYPHFRTLELDSTCKEREIEAEQLKLAGVGERVYGKSSFLGNASQSISSVEQTALDFYFELGYRYGLHAEGSIPVSIFGLLFWNVIYLDEGIPDVFRGPFQPYPLDLHFKDFYTRREGLIEEILRNLRFTWSMEDALDVVEVAWHSNVNKMSIVKWDTFPSLDLVKGLIKSMGLRVVADICERLAKNFRHYRSGFPDLVVWNRDECIFAEVKGPGDKLSAKQLTWLAYLISIGANAEVVRVNAVSNKRIRVT